MIDQIELPPEDKDKGEEVNKWYLDRNEITIRPIFVDDQHDGRVHCSWPTVNCLTGITIAVVSDSDVFDTADEAVSALDSWMSTLMGVKA